MLPIQFRQELSELIKSNERVVFLGIGENRMGDDGFGPYVSYHLLTSCDQFHNVNVINGKTNYVDRKPEIVEFNPDLLILIDTCQAKNHTIIEPGTLMIHEEKDLVNWLPLSSHVLPVPVFTTELKNTITSLNVILIGIIPFSTNYNDPVNPFRPDLYSLDDYEQQADLPFYDFSLSPKIQKIADELIIFLQELLQKTL
jgi:hydrogenase maturation protease